MKVSIITPSFNQSVYLGPALNSVFRQEYPDLEAFVIDGGSTDDTVKVLQEFDGRLAYWCSERDNGQSDAFNKGLARATGDVIGWLNSDDLYLGRCIHDAVAYFKQHPEVDIVFSDYVYVDEHSTVIHYRREIPFDDRVYRWTADCYHANCAGFFRRRVFDRLGGLRTDLHWGMDYEFYLRAADAGVRFGHVRGPWGAYRLHAASKTSAHQDRQKGEGLVIARQFWPAGTTNLQAQFRRDRWRASRVIRKVLLGSYTSARADKQLAARLLTSA